FAIVSTTNIPKSLPQSFEEASEQKYQGGHFWTPITPIQGSILHAGSQVMQVAVSCGYGSTTHFARHYKGAFGVSPSKQRFRMCEARH
ncbi:MAG: hypothetical protein VX791_03350, partial [Pseudomonadota bacterium]|nr:hypothetical protein [Pseudomonadota bacterium]